MSLLFTYIKQNKNYILIILVDFYVILSRFFCYPDPDKLFLRWIRIRQMIRIRPDPDPKHCFKVNSLFYKHKRLNREDRMLYITKPGVVSLLWYKSSWFINVFFKSWFPRHGMTKKNCAAWSMNISSTSGRSLASPSRSLASALIFSNVFSRLNSLQTEITLSSIIIGRIISPLSISNICMVHIIQNIICCLRLRYLLTQSTRRDTKETRNK